MAGCSVGPPLAAESALVRVYADDARTAALLAQACERAWQRLERLGPGAASVPIDVRIERAGALGRGTCGRATRGMFGGWTVRLDARDAYAMLGHELFHVRFHDRLERWPAALEEGLADHLGLVHDVLGDGVRISRLFAAARLRMPTVTLRCGTAGSTFRREHTVFPGLDVASVALDLQEVLGLRASELAQLSVAERALAYGLAHAWVCRQLGDAWQLSAWGAGSGDRFLVDPPQALTPGEGDAAALRAWARQQIDPARVRRWAVACFAEDLRAVIDLNPHRAASADAFLESMAISLSIDDAPFESIRDDPSLRELVALLWD